MELHLLNTGYFTIDKSLLVYTKYQGQIYDAALKPLLMKTEKENILIDTGIGELPEAYKEFHTVKMKPDQTLAMQLQKHGLKPEDIDIVVNTHLHFDHCGNNRLFSKAKFYVQAEEIRYAYAPDRFQAAAYIRDFFDTKADYVTLNGEHEITDNVFVVPTSGHCPGHQSIVVTLEGKNYVYCGDAAPLRENLEKKNIPGVLYRSDEALKSIDRLRCIKNAVYIFSHDNEQMVLRVLDICEKERKDKVSL
jgi:glyoxylase-like metal-dependent hydrolase (beta-lactamase superfamily II)